MAAPINKARRVAEEQYKPKKLFTVDEANATLPLVKAIVGDLVALSREVVERRERLALLHGSRDPDSADPYSEELEQIEDELEKDNRRLKRIRGRTPAARRRTEERCRRHCRFPDPKSKTELFSCAGNSASPSCSTGTSWMPVSRAGSP